MRIELVLFFQELRNHHFYFSDLPPPIVVSEAMEPQQIVL
jgi:hypothetical protein